MTRTVLIHLNVELADDDPRTADDLDRYIAAVIAAGQPIVRDRHARSLDAEMATEFTVTGAEEL